MRMEVPGSVRQDRNARAHWCLVGELWASRLASALIFSASPGRDCRHETPVVGEQRGGRLVPVLPALMVAAYRLHGNLQEAPSLFGLADARMECPGPDPKPSADTTGWCP